MQDHEIAENGGELPETTKYEYNDIRKKVSWDGSYSTTRTDMTYCLFIYVAPKQPFPWHNKEEGKDNSFFFNPKANRNVEM